MKQIRRTNALARLEKQLVSGVKVAKVTEDVPRGTIVPLSDHDKVRITKEITVLKERV